MTNRRGTEFKFYQIPNGEDVFAVMGYDGIREYGFDENRKPVLNNHFHSLMEIGVCREGNGILILNNEKFRYTAGTIAVIPRNYAHDIRNLPGEKSFWEYIYLNPFHFLGRWYGDKREWNAGFSRIESRPFKKQREQIPLFARELDCLMDQIRLKEYGYKNCMKGLVFTLLMEIVKINYEDMEFSGHDAAATAEMRKKIEQALSFVEKHYAEEIRIADIAEAAYISESNLRKIFAEHFHISPLQYVNSVRIEAACDLLKEQDVNISEAARKVGFDNMSTFIRNFKKIKNESPRQWLKSEKAQNDD